MTNDLNCDKEFKLAVERVINEVLFGKEDFPFTVSEGSTKAEMELWGTKSGTFKYIPTANWKNTLVRFPTFQDWLAYSQFLVANNFIYDIGEPIKTTLAQSLLAARNRNMVAVEIMTGDRELIATYPVPEIREEIE